MNGSNKNTQAEIRTIASKDVDAQLQRLAALIVATAPDDLTGLATIHSGFQEIAHLPFPNQSPIGSGLAARGVALISQIMLREREDAAAALKAAGEVVSELQGVLDGSLLPQAAPAEVAKAGVEGEQTTIAGEPVFAAADVQLVNDFIGEATSHLDSAEAELLKLDKNPADADAVNAVFRNFHTIKGVAGFLNLKQIGALAHVCENLLDLARQGQLEISGFTANLVLEAADTMRELVGALGEAVEKGVAAPAQAGLVELIARLKAAALGKPAAASG
ncbi:MAG: Hpt domain-containing protein, partial [Tepidisphaeraceae bacterium]